MTERSLQDLSDNLESYAEEVYTHCSHSCYNCDYGVMQGYGYSATCAFELAANLIYSAARDFKLITKEEVDNP